MDDPVRLLDGGATELERTLLAAACAERPDPILSARMRAGIGLGPMAAPAATGTKLGVKLGASLGAVVLVGAGIAWLALRSQPAELSPAPVAPVQPALGTGGLAAVSPPPALPPATESPAESTVPRRPAARPARPVAAAPASDLPDEIRRLDRARTALRAGSPRRTLQELDGYAERHPAGILRQEAAVLRIEALDGAGDRARAAKMAREFATDHPGSPLLERLRRFNVN